MKSTAALEPPSQIIDLPARVAAMQLRLAPRTAKEIEAWEWENTILPHLKASRLPSRYHRRLALGTCKPQQRAFEQCRSICCGTGAIVALVGPRGLGKTEIAAQLIIDRALNETLLPWHRRPPYRKLTDLIAVFKSIYSDFGSINSETLIGRRNDFCKDHSFVVIDELHDCEDQRAKDRILTDILDRRYANLCDTLLISNQTVEEFARTANPSTLSRLEEHGQIIECTWPSFRKGRSCR